MEKELDYFYVGSNYGFNQENFTDFMMKIGACACVTACDSMIYLKKYKGYEKVYKKDTNIITDRDYLLFANEMRNYLYPRITGIYKLDMYTYALEKYLDDIGEKNIKLDKLEATSSYETAKSKLISKIDEGIILPYLMLLNKNKELKDYIWHWFNISAYSFQDDKLMVKTISYGGYKWIDFEKLHNTGHNKKGGMIIFDLY